METIADAYETNARVREGLHSAIAGLSPEQLNTKPEGEKWSIQQIVEHIAIVYEGTGRICSKLVGQAKEAGTAGQGRINLSQEFSDKSQTIAGLKVEAPERVQPTGQVSVEQALAKMDETKKVFDSLRSALEAYDLSAHKFPHPFFGPITAAEWLVLAGGHELRHTKQIERLKERL